MNSDAIQNSDPDDERQLIFRAQQRNAAAFGRLYEIHLDRIYRYLYYRVGTAREAEDLTEQVFLKAWEAIGRYQHREIPFIAWLYRLAHNVAIDHYRGRHPIADLAEAANYTNETGDVEGTVEQLLAAEDIREAIRSVSPDHQQMLTLRFIEGLSHSEVAAILGKSEGATRVLQHRALQALARVLDSRGETN